MSQSKQAQRRWLSCLLLLSVFTVIIFVYVQMVYPGTQHTLHHWKTSGQVDGGHKCSTSIRKKNSSMAVFLSPFSRLRTSALRNWERECKVSKQHWMGCKGVICYIVPSNYKRLHILLCWHSSFSAGTKFPVRSARNVMKLPEPNSGSCNTCPSEDIAAHVAPLCYPLFLFSQSHSFLANEPASFLKMNISMTL